MNIQQMMKQAQKLQKDMEESKAKIDKQEFHATAGGVIKVTAMGTKEITKIEIDDQLLNPEDKNEVEELIMLAINNVIKDIENETEKQLGAFTNGMNLPF
jgi:DNA-binding YbaB/EbfC family protein